MFICILVKGVFIMKQVKISLPNTLLNDLDEYVQKNKINQKKFIEKALRTYLKKKKKEKIKKDLTKGYIEVSRFNQKLAEQGLEQDLTKVTHYEDVLKKLTENSGYKKKKR